MSVLESGVVFFKASCCCRITFAHRLLTRRVEPPGSCKKTTTNAMVNKNVWNHRTNNKTMDPSPENSRAAWYQGPIKLEVFKICEVSGDFRYRDKFAKKVVQGTLKVRNVILRPYSCRVRNGLQVCVIVMWILGNSCSFLSLGWLIHRSQFAL